MTESDPIDVTSGPRCDTAWTFTDSSGHEHRWHHEDGTPADRDRYDMMKRYHVPSVRYVIDYEALEDYPEEGHYECLQCSERIDPGHCPDTYRQFIPGPTEYFIDDENVTKEDFDRQFSAERSLETE